MPYTLTQRLAILGRRINRAVMSVTAVLPWRTTLPPAEIEPPEAHDPPPAPAPDAPEPHDQQHVDPAQRLEHGHPKR